jgi:hypothetical protein
MSDGLDGSDKKKSLVEKSEKIDDEIQASKSYQDIDDFFASYRRNLAIRIIFGFATLFLLILELVFHRTIYNSIERDWIFNIQKFFSTNSITNKNFIVTSMSELFKPYWVFMIITHLMFTIYYGVNAILGSKIILSCLVVFSAAKILNLLHREPRPFWMENKNDKSILGWGCNATFANPDLSILPIMFFAGYVSHCFRRRGYDKGTSFFKQHLFTYIGAIVCFLIIFVKVISGELFFT